MLARILGFSGVITLALAFGGCSDAAKPKKKKPGKADEAPAAQDKAPEGPAAPADEPSAAGDGQSSEQTTPEAGGAALRPHPDWYSLEIIPHQEVVQNGRSEAREDGTFSAAMVLKLDAEWTADKCTEHVAKQVGLDFKEAEKGDDGRLTSRAETGDMRVTVVCGEAKGTPTVYVGYEWKQ
jgi:hypothetical protein